MIATARNILLVVLVLLTMLTASTVAIERRRDLACTRRRVVTPVMLRDYLKVATTTGGRGQPTTTAHQSIDTMVHLVYDFKERQFVLLRSGIDSGDGDGVERYQSSSTPSAVTTTTIVERRFPFPADTRRRHVRFPSSVLLNRRYSAARSRRGDDGPRLEDLIDIEDRDRILRRDADAALADPLSAWGGRRLRVRLLRANNEIRLRFNGQSPSLTLRLPIGVAVTTDSTNRTDGSIAVRFARDSAPCSSSSEYGGAVRYGDFVRNYVGRGDKADLLERSEYDRVLPYMRWICKSPDDANPILTLDNDDE